MPFLSSISLPEVTIIVPVYNGSEFILETIYSIIKSDDADVNIIIVNDGSTDSTLSTLISHFKLKKLHIHSGDEVSVRHKVKSIFRSETNINLLVIDKEHGGKSDAQNSALNICHTPLFITLDADTLLEPDAINSITFELLSKKNVVAVGGALYILNGCEYKNGSILQKKMSKNPICIYQTCEYLRSFLFNRSGWNTLRGALCYSGAFTLFQHKFVVEIGGFDYNNPSQDFEIITHLQASSYEKNNNTKVSYTTAASAWTMVPDTICSLGRQRFIWQTGILMSIIKFKYMFLNPRYGITGLYTFPVYLLTEALGIFVEFVSYILVIISWYIGILDQKLTLYILAIIFIYVTLLTVATALISFITYNKYLKIFDIIPMIIISLLENLGIRQYLTICRIYSSIIFFLSRRSKVCN
jgi:cellulose synthase/poly-beta-1,6-N-acetylglucosamine synthase-like glycosyltransferase